MWYRKTLREPLYFGQRCFQRRNQNKVNKCWNCSSFGAEMAQGLKKTRFAITSQKTLMFWGAIRYYGVKCLVLCHDGMNIRGYSKTLEYDKKNAKCTNSQSAHHQRIFWSQAVGYFVMPSIQSTLKPY